MLPNPSFSQATKHLALIFLFACFLRAGRLLSPLGVDQPLMFDENEFASIGRTLATEGRFEGTYNELHLFKAHRPPLYPALLAGAHALVSHEHFVRAAKIMQLFLGSLIPLLVYLYVTLLQGRPHHRNRSPLICGLVAAAYPYLAF